MRQWYRMEVAAEEPATADIYIIDFIGDWLDDYWGFGVTAKAFIEQLTALPDAVRTIRVHVNSPGGDVFAAVNIANALRDQRLSKQRTVEVEIDGLAASAASVLIMAGDPIRMGDNALIMIHQPWTVAIGDAAELKKTVKALDKIRDTIVTTYQWHSPLEADVLIALMDAETWMDADEAIAKGFATEKVEGLQAAASLNPRGLAKLTVPARYRARVEALIAKPAPAPCAAAPAEVLRLCRERDCLDLAEELITAGATLEQVQARLDEALRRRADLAARTTQIRALCDQARLPELVDGYLQGAMTIDAIRAQLTTLTAKLDAIDVDGSLLPDHRAQPKSRINVDAVYAARNRLTKE